jgi:DNA polymerase-1
MFRIARNMPIQGTGADITKLAMCLTAHKLAPRLDAHIVNMVHDELVVECDFRVKDEVRSLVSSAMERAFGMVLPEIPASISFKERIGKS